MVTVFVNGDGTGGVQASPYNVQPGQTVVVGTNHGNVTLNLPVLLVNQQAEIKQSEADDASYVGTISVVAPGGVAIAKLDHTLTAAGGTYVLPNGAGNVGQSVAWFNGRSPTGDYLIR